MALTFLDMQAEVLARGLGDMSASPGLDRVKRAIVDAVHEIDGLADWPYKLASTTGSVPLTIADLDVIECVTDVATLNPLQPTDRRFLRETFVDLTAAGTASYYYFTGQNTITTYPVTTATLTVDYWKVSTDLSADGDQPLMPDRFRKGPIHYAVSYLLKDRGDEAGSASARQDGDRIVSQMMGSLLVQSHQRAAQWVPAVGTDS